MEELYKDDIDSVFDEKTLALMEEIKQLGALYALIDAAKAFNEHLDAITDSINSRGSKVQVVTLDKPFHEVMCELIEEAMGIKKKD